jgi:hypothetical protein
MLAIGAVKRKRIMAHTLVDAVELELVVDILLLLLQVNRTWRVSV